MRADHWTDLGQRHDWILAGRLFDRVGDDLHAVGRLNVLNEVVAAFWHCSQRQLGHSCEHPALGADAFDGHDPV